MSTPKKVRIEKIVKNLGTKAKTVEANSFETPTSSNDEYYTPISRNYSPYHIRKQILTKNHQNHSIQSSVQATLGEKTTVQNNDLSTDMENISLQCTSTHNAQSQVGDTSSCETPQTNSAGVSTPEGNASNTTQRIQTIMTDQSSQTSAGNIESTDEDRRSPEPIVEREANNQVPTEQNISIRDARNRQEEITAEFLMMYDLLSNVDSDGYSKFIEYINNKPDVFNKPSQSVATSIDNNNPSSSSNVSNRVELRKEGRNSTNEAVKNENRLNNSQWTLKYRNLAPGLTELVPNRGIYVNDMELQTHTLLAKNYNDLARRLLGEIFSAEALVTCSYGGANLKTGGRPGLDEDARKTLLIFLEQQGKKKGWGRFEPDSIIKSLGSRLGELRARNRKSVDDDGDAIRTVL